MATHLSRHFTRFKQFHPEIQNPLIVSAPMRVFAGPSLATAVYRAGGIGFLGPGAKPTDLDPTLQETRDILKIRPEQPLPIGVGFQTFDADLLIALAALKKHKPVAVWLFAPRNGQDELNEWIREIKLVSPKTQFWIQVGSVRDAIVAAQAKVAPDVLVVQGIDAGGHGLEKGAGIISLVPEIVDAVKDTDISVLAAGGIVDGRGVAAALGLGAIGAVMGTRFLASTEAKISKGYQKDILRISDGGQNTVRTKLYDQMAGRTDWPAEFDGRNIVNGTFEDHGKGMGKEENVKLYREALKKGDEGWGEQGRLTAYMGTGIGLIDEVKNAQDIVKQTRDEAIGILKGLSYIV